jgi:large conductance mechanosensitive channel
MLKGFKDFVMRGNVIDLAVGVVVGAAFTTVVTSFTQSFLEPLIKLVGANDVKTGGSWKIGHETYVTWGSFLSSLITFLMTAAVVYFLVVLPMNRLAARRKAGIEPAPAAPSEEVKLLTEIRDALVSGKVPAQTRAEVEARIDTLS